MRSNLSRKEVSEEGNLLIEAVTLLVQRQRESESWVAEQIWQAEERSAATERRYAEIEERLEGIEEHLARLIHEIEPPRGEGIVDERLLRLREQVEGLRLEQSTERTSARSAPAPAVSPESGATPVAAGGAAGVTFWDVLGKNPQDRLGVVLIGAGAVAVLYAILTQLRF